MDRTHLHLLTQGAMVWNSQRPRIESLSGQELEESYQQYLQILSEVNGKWLDNDALEPKSLEDYREGFLEVALKEFRRGAVNLAGADLRGMDLYGYDLSWSNVRGARLDRTDLRDSQLVHTDLTGAQLIGADLRGAHLEKAHLDRASLSGALVEQTSLDAAGIHLSDYQKQNLLGPFTGLPALSLDEWAAIVQEYQKRCAYCGGPYEIIDHVLPLREGGVTWRGNLVPACFVCARARSDPQTRDKVIPASVMQRIAGELKRRAQSDQEES